MHVILAFVVLSQVGGYGLGGNPTGPLGRGRAGAVANQPLFAAFRSSGKGMPSTTPSICSELTDSEMDAGASWCISGVTQDSRSSVTMNRQDAGYVVTTVKQCSGAPDCYSVVGVYANSNQSAGGGPLFKSDAVNLSSTTTGSFTACAWTRHTTNASYSLALREDSDTGAMRYELGQQGSRTHFAKMSTTSCGSSTSTVGTWATQPWVDASIPDGVPILQCVRYNGTQASLVTSKMSSISYTGIGAHCAGGSSARYLYGGLSTVSTDGTYLAKNAMLFGGFHVSTYLSDSRISEIATNLHGNAIRSERGTLLTNARSTYMWCESEDGQFGTWLSPSMTCATAGGIYKRRESLNYWKNGTWFSSGSGHGTVSVTVTDNEGFSPDGIKDADSITFTTGTGYLWRPYYSGVCPTGASVLSFYVKGTTASGTIRAAHDQGGGTITACTSPCAYTTAAWSRCKFPVTTSSTHSILIGQFSTGSGTNCSSPTTSTAGQKVLLWGIQCEADLGGGLATPYMSNSGLNYTYTADKPTFSVGASATAPISMAASWVSPPVAQNLGDIAGNTGYPPYLLSLSSSGSARNSIAFQWYTVEYKDGSSSPMTLSMELSSDEGTIRARGETTAGYASSFSVGSDSITGTGSGSSQSWNEVNIGWSGSNLNFDGVIKNVCIDKKVGKCQ